MDLPARFDLAALPTPLLRATRLEKALGASPIWVKRDDLTGFAVAGSKVRPLEFLLADAVQRGADTFVATGSPGSHFCAAAAAAARVAGLACELLYAGDEPSPAPITVRLAAAAGARLRFDATLTRSELDTAVCAYAERLAAAGRTPYVVPRGGATAVGAAGFAAAGSEVSAQCAAAGVGQATLVLPTGSGASQAGLLVGLAASGLKLHVVGASVSRPAQQVRVAVAALAHDCARLLHTVEPNEADVEVRDAIGAGFGVASPADRDSAASAYVHEGLLLDGTYTSKAMTVLCELASTTNGPLVFWQTGGLDGALASVGDLATVEKTS